MFWRKDLKITNKIPPIFIINLDKDINKRKYMLSLCKKLSLDCHIFNAINGYLLKEEEIKKKYSENKAISEFGKPLTLGEIGCFLSHLSIYKKMIEENIEEAIVLEDDVSLTNNFKKIINYIYVSPS